MALFGRNSTTVGLDIGSGLIKLVAISHRSGEPVLTNVAFASVVSDAIVVGEVMDPALVADAIKGLLAGMAAVGWAASATSVAFLWHNVIGAVAVVIVGMAVSLVTKRS